MQHPAVQPISFSSYLKYFLVILQALSLFAKITKLPSFLVTLQALSLFLAKVTKTSFTIKLQISHATQLQPTLTCSSGVVTYFPRLPLLPGTLSPDVGKIYHAAMGHRYFNLAMTCGIYPRYAHASHKSASASRFPTL